MKFGIGLFSMQTHADLKVDHGKLYSAALEQTKLAEDVGFDSAWLSEHHFLEDGYCPSPLVTAAAMAAVTNTIRIGTAAMILPLHNPVRVAEDAAVVDNISGGRLDLGVAIGYRKEEFDGFGLSIRNRPSLIEEGVDVLLKSWSDGRFSYKGKRFDCENIDVTPKPVQKPHIPLYIGAFEEPAVKRAGRLGYPLLIGPGRTLDMIRDTLGWYNAAAREAGHDPSKAAHVLLRETFVDSGKKGAFEGGEKYIVNMYKFYFTLGVKIFIRGERVKKVDDPLFKHLAEDRFVIGTPEHCAGEIETYRREVGIENIACRMIFPQAPPEDTSRRIDLFGKEVIPVFS